MHLNVSIAVPVEVVVVAVDAALQAKLRNIIDGMLPALGANGGDVVLLTEVHLEVLRQVILGGSPRGGV